MTRRWRKGDSNPRSPVKGTVVFENVRSTSSFRESDRRFEALSLRQRICLPIGRYTSGGEFMEVVKVLWDSWATDAVIDDRTAGGYARRTA